MEYFIKIFEPKKVYSQEEFPKLVARWKDSDYDDGCISIETRFSYFNKKFITVAPMDMWTSQYVNGIRHLLSFDEGSSKSGKWRTPSEIITEFHQKYPTKKGTFYEMTQSGHSLILQMGMCKLKNTIRSYIYAETILLPYQIAITRKMASKFFNVYTQENSVLIPDSITVFLKRDPVLWMGGLVPVMELIFVDKPELEAVGLSPIVMDAMNADVDGDTAIFYIVESNEATRKQQESLLSPYVYGIYGSRWTPTTSHLQLIFHQMVFEYFEDPWSLDGSPDIFNKFQECLENYEGTLFGDFKDIFLKARAQVKQPIKLFDILRDMLIISYYEDRSWGCIKLFNDLLSNGKMLSITKFSRNSFFFAVMEFTQAAKYKNPNFFEDLVRITEQDPHDYLFTTCPEKFIKQMNQFRSEYINSSSDLPKQSYQISLLLNNVQNVKYLGGNICFDDTILIEDLYQVVSLEDFVDSKGLNLLLDYYEEKYNIVPNKIF